MSKNILNEDIYFGHKERQKENVQLCITSYIMCS